MEQNDIFITCHPHIGPFLSKEVESLGFKVAKQSLKGILTTGTFADTMKLNLNLRTANRVLYKISSMEVNSIDELYSKTREIAWETIIPVSGYFSVDSSVRHSGIKDSRIANLKLKDAIVDRMRLKTRKRPDSGPYKDHTVIYLHWYNQQAHIYIDTSGETISKHGYRHNPYKAPMIESLAAAVIRASGWDVGTPFINPMCGSGTLAIEAALIAIGKPPGVFRDNFGFMHTKWYNPEMWRVMRNQAISGIRDYLPSPIIASDISPKAVNIAKQNARSAKVDKFIEFQVCDFRDTKLPSGTGIVLMNPEYGERIGDLKNLEKTYRDIGDFYKNHCQGKTGYIFTGNLDLAKKVGLRSSERTIFFNGKIECRLLKYELYSGTKKMNKRVNNDVV